MKTELYDISSELNCVSATVSGLSISLLNESRLNDNCLSLALQGISEHLERIAADIDRIDDALVEA